MQQAVPASVLLLRSAPRAILHPGVVGGLQQDVFLGKFVSRHDVCLAGCCLVAHDKIARFGPVFGFEAVFCYGLNTFSRCGGSGIYVFFLLKNGAFAQEQGRNISSNSSCVYMVCLSVGFGFGAPKVGRFCKCMSSNDGHFLKCCTFAGQVLLKKQVPDFNPLLQPWRKKEISGKSNRFIGFFRSKPINRFALMFLHATPRLKPWGKIVSIFLRVTDQTWLYKYKPTCT
jgi:hypothetical protein